MAGGVSVVPPPDGQIGCGGGCDVAEAESAEAHEHCAELDERRAGVGSEKLRMFEKVRAAGGFANEHPADLAEAEKKLREFVEMEEGRVSCRVNSSWMCGV